MVSTSIRTGGVVHRRPAGRIATARGLTVLVLTLCYAAGALAQSIQNPRRIAAGPAGQVLVSDRSGLVFAVDRHSLDPVWSFQLPADGAPFGLAASKRRVFVGNTETMNVEVYRLKKTRGGGHTLQFAYNLGDTQPGELGGIQHPISIGVDAKKKLVFVLDAGAKLIKVFSSRGGFSHEFPPVDEAGQVLSPVAVEVDQQRREVLVADYGDPSGGLAATTPARILIYSYNGELRDQINGSGFFGRDLVFRRVQGMAISADGRIFAADPLAGRIVVFDRNSGGFLQALGTQGSEPGQLMIPTDVMLDSRTGDLFVVNNRGGRKVEVFLGAGR